MTNEDFLKIRKQIDHDFITTPENFKQQTLRIPMLVSRYRHLYIKCKREFNTLKNNKIKLYGKLYHHYKFDIDFQLDTKKEIEMYVESDDKYIDILSKYQEMEIQVKYFEEQINSLKNLSYWYSNYVEYSKLKEGM